MVGIKKSKKSMEEKKKEIKNDIRERCYRFSLDVINFIDRLEIKRIYFFITDQLLRSATSVEANIVEAKSASSKKDFINFYQIALKSANETKYWLCLLRDGLKIQDNKIKPLLTESDKSQKLLRQVY